MSITNYAKFLFQVLSTTWNVTLNVFLKSDHPFNGHTFKQEETQPILVIRNSPQHLILISLSISWIIGVWLVQNTIVMTPVKFELGKPVRFKFKLTVLLIDRFYMFIYYTKIYLTHVFNVRHVWLYNVTCKLLKQDKKMKVYFVPFWVTLCWKVLITDRNSARK